jgi:hypothetical protein
MLNSGKKIALCATKQTFYKSLNHNDDSGHISITNSWEISQLLGSNPTDNGAYISSNSWSCIAHDVLMKILLHRYYWLLIRRFFFKAFLILFFLGSSLVSPQGESTSFVQVWTPHLCSICYVSCLSFYSQFLITSHI